MTQREIVERLRHRYHLNVLPALVERCTHAEDRQRALRAWLSIQHRAHFTDTELDWALTVWACSAIPTT